MMNQALLLLLLFLADAKTWMVLFHYSYNFPSENCSTKQEYVNINAYKEYKKGENN